MFSLLKTYRCHKALLSLSQGSTKFIQTLHSKAIWYLFHTLLTHHKLLIWSTYLCLLQECVRGALRGKTILLVTHQVDFLHNVDLILIIVFSPLSFLQLLFSLSRTNTYMCFSYLNFKHFISFVIPGYERWDDSAV